MSEHREGHGDLLVGAVLAGGLGRRLGGEKATARLRGRSLIEYPLDALRAVVADVAVVAKPDTTLPALPGITVWSEPGVPRHPLVGLIHALRRADGRPVLVCAADLPLVTPALIACLAASPPSEALARLAAYSGQLQPLLGRYEPAAVEPLEAALAQDPRAPLREAVARLGPELVAVKDPAVLFNVNTPADLRRAGTLLEELSRRSPT